MKKHKYRWRFFLKVIGTPILTQLGTSTQYCSLDISIVSHLHKYNKELVSFHFVIDLHIEQNTEPSKSLDVCVLATGTYRPGSGCCTSCMRSRRPLCVQTPLQPHPPSLDELASRPHTHRIVPACKWMKHTNTHCMSHHSTAAHTPLQIQQKANGIGVMYLRLCPPQ